ncbi:cellulose biosynthesis protein BcsC [Halotalea alkalilenta]|uniref:cellulose biosynthesis protein BcsC n=1 Tax=Halotalea alkalilenta TaxID=376489 RepID=UPI00048624EB|nr:cellulose biosynthesis protein BcsC [Halotalea alkalilenta]
MKLRWLLLLPTFFSMVESASAQDAVPAGPATSGSATLDALFRQSDYWRQRNREDLALDALNRVLRVDPDNAEALFRFAQLALESGDTEGYQRWRARLEEVDDGRLLAQLDQERRGADVSTDQLEQARAAAREGNAEVALERYRSLFGGGAPPERFALEYYQTLAGTQAGWEEARTALEDYRRRHPTDQNAEFALGQVLTYREETRREGIASLMRLSGNDRERARAIRQALLWLDADIDDKPLFDAYLTHNLMDTDVRDHFLRSVAEETPADPLAQERQRGFAALEAGSGNAAAAAFQRVIEARPNDVDALGGLGISQLRAGQFARARDSLGRAMQLDPSSAERWRAAFRSASLYADLAEARRLAESGDATAALARVAPLTRESGDGGRAARAFEAQLLLDQQEFSLAEQRYRAMLAQAPNDADARVGLVNALRGQSRWQEAEQLAAQLPEQLRQRLGDPNRAQVEELRELARQAAERNDLDGAQTALEQALALLPDDPWTRLELARIYDRQGHPYQASFTMMPLIGSQTSDERLYAAALFASEQSRWDDAERLIGRIPIERRDPAAAQLAERIAIEGRLAAIRDQSDPGRARQSLMALYRQPPADPAELGSVALAFSDLGDDGLALDLVRGNLGRGIQVPVDRYYNHIVVLGRSGQGLEAEELLRSFDQLPGLSAADRDSIEAQRNALALAVAERLRADGDLAGAYDQLAARLSVAPQDRDLQLALGDLYLGGDKARDAELVYRYVLGRTPSDQRALAGAVNASLALGEPERAEALLLDRAPLESPELVILAARTAQAQGREDEAIRLLEQVRERTLATRRPLVAADPLGGVLGLNANPFRSESARNSAPTAFVSPEARQLSEVDRLLAEWRRERGIEIEASTDFRLRSGEQGLSELTGISQTTRFGVPLARGRLELALSPVYISAGSASSSSASRFGSNALVDGIDNLSTALGGVDELLGDIQSSATAVTNALALLEAAEAEEYPSTTQIASLRNSYEAALSSYEDAMDRNVLWEAGIRFASLSDEQLALLSDFAGVDLDPSAFDISSWTPEEFAANREALASSIEALQSSLSSRFAAAARGARSPASLHDSGVGLELAYKIGDWRFDAGSTPLGFEQSNLVGGVRWQPQIATDTRLTLTAERRAVSDSVLSYAGVKDPVTGETWGGVTKSGGQAMVSYDDGELGFYAGGGGYHYSGENVQSNSSRNLSVGAYVRPINEEHRKLQVGVNLGYQDFDRNSNHFTYGHGGYFSPQDYINLAFPVSFTETRGKFSYILEAAPGLQSFDQEGADYFPTDARSQRALEAMETAGLVSSSSYDGESTSGFGVNLGVGVDYRLSEQLTLGGKLGYDTFGDYSESRGMLYLNYRLGGGDGAK